MTPSPSSWIGTPPQQGWLTLMGLLAPTMPLGGLPGLVLHPVADRHDVGAGQRRAERGEDGLGPGLLVLSRRRLVLRRGLRRQPAGVGRGRLARLGHGRLLRRGGRLGGGMRRLGLVRRRRWPASSRWRSRAGSRSPGAATGSPTTGRRPGSRRPARSACSSSAVTAPRRRRPRSRGPPGPRRPPRPRPGRRAAASADDATYAAYPTYPGHRASAPSQTPHRLTTDNGSAY